MTRSSARRMGAQVRGGVALCYLIALCLWGVSIWLVRPDWVALLALIPMALHLSWQVVTLDRSDGRNALHRFRSNRNAGFLMFAACFVVGTAL